jgi:hypothetical protein
LLFKSREMQWTEFQQGVLAFFDATPRAFVGLHERKAGASTVLLEQMRRDLSNALATDYTIHIFYLGRDRRTPEAMLSAVTTEEVRAQNHVVLYKIAKWNLQQLATALWNAEGADYCWLYLDDAAFVTDQQRDLVRHGRPLFGKVRALSLPGPYPSVDYLIDSNN